MQVIVHAGYPKAASSTLQIRYFNKHPGIEFLGIFPRGNKGKTTEDIEMSARDAEKERVSDIIHYAISIPEESDYQRYLKKHQKEINSFLWKISKVRKKKKVVYSDESLLSMFGPPLEIKMERVMELFGDVKVLVVLRNQISLLKSKYRDRPGEPDKGGRGKSISPDKWVKKIINDPARCAMLDYPSVLDRIYKVTKNKPEVILFEELTENWEQTVNILSEIIDIRSTDRYESILRPKIENKGVTRQYQWVRDTLYKLHLKEVVSKLKGTMIGKVGLKFLLSGEKQEVKFSSTTLSLIIYKIGQANHQTEKLLGYDLQKYGYPISS